MTHDKLPISDLTLERYRLAELPADQAAMIAARAVSDPEVRGRLDALAHSDNQIRERYSQDWLARTIAARLPNDPPSRSLGRVAPIWAAVAGVCALFVAALIGLPSLRSATVPSPTSEVTDGTRVKGDAASLLLYRRAGSSAEQLTDGEAARRGDLIRVAYRCGSRRFGIILSIDGRGVITRHLPVTGAAAAVLEPGSPTLLDQAYELDDAPRWEQFFVISSETAFDVQAVLDAARAAAARAGTDPPSTLALPRPLEQSSFLLRKIS